MPSIAGHALGGTVGGVLAEAILFPVDTIKIQLQTASTGAPGGFLDTAVQIFRSSGAAGFYRGLHGALFTESVHSLNFWVWHGLLFRHASRFDDTSRTPPMQRLVLNLLAKQLNWLCTTPFEVVSSMNQVTPGSPGFTATAARLYKEGGLSAFYRGIFISLFLAINPAIMNTLIVSLLRVVAVVKQARGVDYVEARNHNVVVVGCTTALSKVFATLLTYPLIRAKVLQQTGSGEGIQQVFRGIIDSEGFSGLYRGVLAMSYKTVLWNSLMMVFKQLLGPKRAITPPGTPQTRSPRGSRMMPFMSREPFPAELTSQKLDEILTYLQVQGGASHTSKRLDSLEERVNEATHEMRQIRSLLASFVATAQAETNIRTRSLAGKDVAEQCRVSG